MQLTSQSRSTLYRFGKTIAIVATIGAIAWQLGLPARNIMALLCNFSCVLALMFSYVLQERIVPPHLGRIDEAAWLFLISHAVRVGPHG